MPSFFIPFLFLYDLIINIFDKKGVKNCLFFFLFLLARTNHLNGCNYETTFSQGTHANRVFIQYQA